MFTSEDTVIHSTDTLLPFKTEVRRERDLASQLGRNKDGITVLLYPTGWQSWKPLYLANAGLQHHHVVDKQHWWCHLNSLKLLQCFPGPPLQATSLRIHEILFRTQFLVTEKVILEFTFLAEDFYLQQSLLDCTTQLIVLLHTLVSVHIPVWF